MMKNVLDLGQRAVVVGLVGMTLYTGAGIASSLMELRQRRRAYEAAQTPQGQAPPSTPPQPSGPTGK